jgi:hypothetical protein
MKSRKDEGKSVALYLKYAAASGQSLGEMNCMFVVNTAVKDITRC